jgi:tRNA A-37 threonylcarbamoyl transferase component Bud32
MGGTSRYSTPAKLQNYFIAPRTDAISWVDPHDDLVWVFGGFGTLTLDPTSPTGYLNDLWAWNKTSSAWSQVSPTNVLNEPGFIAEISGVPSPNNKPPARCCAAAFPDESGRLYFFGGFGMSSILNQPSSTPDFVGDMWVLETAPFYRDRAWTWVSGGVTKPPPAAVWAPRPDAIVSPGSRAWMECWTNKLTNEAFIFGSLGTSARISTSTPVPAYYQDLWAFVLPKAAVPPLPAPAKPSQTAMIIIWSVVGGQFLLLLVMLLVLFIRRRRSRPLDSEPFSSLEMAKLDNSHYSITTTYAPNGHYSTYNATPGVAYGKSPASRTPSTSPPMTTSTISEDPLPVNQGKKNGNSKTSNSSNSSGLSVVIDAPGGNSGGTNSRGSKRQKSGASRESSQVSPSNSGNTKTAPSTTSKRSHSVASNHSGHSSGVRPAKAPAVKASFDLMIKKRDLEFGNIIGRGSSGTIYSGRWHDQRVAIKQLATEALVGEREGALEEAKMVGMIRPHPNVIQIFGVCVSKQHVFIVMSKMHSSLDKLVYHVQRRNWLTPERMYRMAMGIVAGMIHLDSQGICHRDLAARNVCLSKTGNPCITDFGMSRKLNFSVNAGETQTQMGPVAWMAPECFLQRYSSKSDVWSFGILLFEMLTGNLPHRGTDLHQLAVEIRDHGVTPSPIPSTCDAGLVDIMKSCWAFDPAARPSWTQISKNLRAYARFTDESEEDDSSAMDLMMRANRNSIENARNFPKSGVNLRPAAVPSGTATRASSPLPPLGSDDGSSIGTNTSGTLSAASRTNPKSGATSGNSSAQLQPHSRQLSGLGIHSSEEDSGSTEEDEEEESGPSSSSDSEPRPPLVAATPQSPLFFSAPVKSPPGPSDGHGDYVSGF